MADLPPENIRRWVVRHKAAVLAALRSGAITLEEACRRYGLTEEEIRAWQHAFDAHGLQGLTRLSAYRSRRSKPPERHC
jgi:transposase-like protein